MNKRKAQMERRTFLQMSSGSLAAFASRGLWRSWPVGTPGPQRHKPSESIQLASSKLKILLDRQDGLPFEYQLLPNYGRFRGEELGEQITATICDRSAWKFATVPITSASVKSTANQADFSFTASFDTRPAASFTVRYIVEESSVRITLEDVREFSGFELIDVALPRLASVREEDGASWLAHGDDGGSLAMLSSATPGVFLPNTFWGNVMASLPVVMIGTEKILCVQETTAFMDSTVLAVAGNEGQRLASIGTVQNHRVNGSLCYDMNLGSNAPRNCGNQNTPNLLIEQKPSCRLDFVVPSPGKNTVDWLDGARLVRSRMPAIQLTTTTVNLCMAFGAMNQNSKSPQPRSRNANKSYAKSLR